jgi:hypothetical protein
VSPKRLERRYPQQEQQRRKKSREYLGMVSPAVMPAHLVAGKGNVLLAVVMKRMVEVIVPAELLAVGMGWMAGTDIQAVPG